MKKQISLFMSIFLLIMELLPLAQSNLVNSAYAYNHANANLNQEGMPYLKDQVDSVANSTHSDPSVYSNTYNLPVIFPSTSVTTDTYNKFQTSKYIVTYASNNRKQNKMMFFQKGETRKVLRSYKNIPQELMLLSESELAELRTNPDIINIEPDYSVSLSGLDTSSHEATTLSYEGLNGEQLYSMQANGQGIRVGIIDSGIDIHHPDILVSGGVSFLDDTFNDTNGHGTEIAGIIAAQLNNLGIKGLAPNTEVYALKAFNASGTASHSNIIAAIDWAIENDINILNMSFGGKENGQALQSAIQAAWDAGILLVSASGNEGQSIIEYPAGYPSVMAVGAVNNDLTQAAFSNHSDKLELVAFGSDIYTTTLNSSYRLVSGTSYAAAQVTASAAALWSYHPEWTAEMVRTALLNSSTSIGEQNKFGYGLVNPLGAVKGQFSRNVTIDFEGTVSGAVYGNFFTKLSYLNKTPSQSPYTMKLGQSTSFSVVSENDIVDYYTGVFDSENVKIQNKYVPSGTGVLPAGSLLFHDFITDASMAVGAYTVKISPCFETSGGYGCPVDSAIKWDVILEPPVGPDTEKPVIQSLKPDQTYFELFKPVTLEAVASDNRSVSKMTFWYSKELSDGEWGSDYYIEEVLNNPLSSNMTGSVKWTPTQGGGYYRFKVVAYDEAGNSSWYSTDQKFYVNPDITPPRVGLSYDQSARLMSGYDIPISFSAFDDGGISEMYLRIYRANDPENQADLNNNVELKLNSSVAELLTNGYGSFFWRAETWGWHRISIVAVDSYGNRTEEMVTNHSFTDVYIAKPTVVFVPGFMNSNLDQRLQGIQRRVFVPTEVLDQNGQVRDIRSYGAMDIGLIIGKLKIALSLDGNGSSAYDLATSGIIKSGMGEDIGKLVDKLILDGIDVIEADYDWRLDLAGAEVQGAIDSKIKEALIKTHGQPISIITYSMGALPTRKYILDHQYEQGMNIDSLINIAPPSLGTFYGFKGMEMGDDLGFLDNMGIEENLQDFLNDKILRPIINNMTSVYDLIPGEMYSKEYENILDQKPFYSDNKSVKNHTTLVQYMQKSNKFNNKLLQKAFDFRDDIENGNINSSIKQYRFVGFKKYYESSNPQLRDKADTGADIIGMKRIYKQRYGYENSPEFMVEAKPDIFIRGMGDSVVPLKSAAYRFEPNTNVYYSGRIHATIVGDSDVNAAIQEIVKTGFTTTKLITDPAQIPTIPGTDITFNCPVNVSVHDANGNYAGLDENGALVNNIPELNYDIIGETKTLYIPEGVDLQFDISGYDTGTMDVHFIDYEQEKPVTSNALIDVGIINGTKLSFSFNALIEDNKDVNILYDFRGDGQTTVLHPGQQIPFDQLMNDEVPPVTTLLIEPALHNNWTGGSAVISLSAADAASGVSGIYYQLDGGPETEYKTPFTVEGAGGHVITYFAMDYSGNIEERRTQIVQIDMTAPGKPMIVPTTTDWTNEDVSLNIIDGTDLESGAHKSQYKIGADGQWLDYTVPFEVKVEGIIPVYARTIDYAGNVGAETSVSTKIDKTPPVTGPVISLSEMEWTKNDVTATLADGPDALSGVQKSQYKLTSEGVWMDYLSPVLVKAEGQTRIYGRTLDNANNISNETSSLILIDRTPPQAPGTVFLASKTASSVVLAWSSAIDNASGIVGYDVYNGETLVGSTDKTHVRIAGLAPHTAHLFTVRAKDAAGNISVASTVVRAVLTDPAISALRSSFVIKNDGTVWAWGENKGGELGNRTFDKASIPAVSPLQDYEAIASGSEYTMGLKKDGALWAWGKMVPGSLKQESDGTWVTEPVPVANLGAVTSVAAGPIHRLAVQEDGTVWAWGANVLGESGNYSLNPVQVPQLDSVVSVSAGLVHSLALKSDGTVWAWGGNGDGQLGDGSLIDKLLPIQVSGLSSMIAISAGTHLSLGLKSDGTVWAWGNNIVGPVGDGRDKGSLTPVQVSGLTGVVSVKAGDYFGMALKADGTVWAWGANSSGALGNGTIQPALTPVRVSHLSGIADIAVGDGYVLAVKENGSLWSWGSNWSGGLGVGRDASYISTTRLLVNISGSPSDASPPGVPELKVTGVTANSVVLEWSEPTDDMAVEGYEINRDGVWGASTNVTGVPYTQATSYTVTGLSPVTKYSFSIRAIDGSGKTSSWSNTVTITTGVALPQSISAGAISSLVLKSDGTVWVCGSSRYSQLTQVQGLHSIVSISQGAEHALALQSNGTVWSWGKGSMGQLGIPNVYNSETPIQIPGLSQVVSIKAANAHSLAVKSDGSVWTWGSNLGGQLGLGNSSLIFQMTPVQVPWLSNVKAVSGGASNSIALQNNGTVWSWGDNTHGQVGDGTSVVRYSPVVVAGLPEVKAISTGMYHNMAVDANGNVWSWGGNFWGQLGDGTMQNRSRPVRVSGISEAVSDVSAGSDFNVVLAASGKVWSWGTNSKGQLGDGTTAQRLSPILVSSLSEQNMISAGGGHGLSLGKNGGIWSWGNNYNYQLGDGTSNSRTTPVLMLGVAKGVASKQSGDTMELTSSLPDPASFSANLEEIERYEKQFGGAPPGLGWKDVYAPTIPVITKVEQEAGRLVIKWSDSEDNVEVVCYEICSGNRVLGETSATEWVLDEILEGVRFVTVQALDAAGNRSIPSRAIIISNGKN